MLEQEPFHILIFLLFISPALCRSLNGEKPVRLFAEKRTMTPIIENDKEFACWYTSLVPKAAS